MANLENEIRPREVADKSSKENLHKAMKMALEIESEAVRENTQSFNQNRYKAVSEIEDYEELKDRARKIKEESIENISELISQLQKAIENRRGYFFLAKTKQEANEYIKSVCQKHKAKLVVKAKSMTSEEIKLNSVLEEAGIEIAETDLAEFILQYSDEQPSHNVAPAIHRSRERISELFKQKFDTELPLDSGEDLTQFARDILRKKFLTADVGISGANVISADSGTIVLVESEGNIRMVTQTPSVHIAIAGIEKVILKKEDLPIFIELLAASGTGQPLSSYTNIINPPLDLPSFSFVGSPKKNREFHLVLIDNGRMKMREDPELRQALYCIRCSACLNSCANFQTVGGHAFGGETYSGGIGGAWEAGTGKLENARFSELCTGCSRCVNQCPVRINIPWLNTVLRNRFNQLENKVAPAQKQFFANFANSAKLASQFTPISNWISNLSISKSFFENKYGVDRRREIPEIVSKTLEKQFKKLEKDNPESQRKNKAVLFADVYTNYNNPNCGMATFRILSKLGINVSVSDVMAEGRASLSQGLIEVAQKRAKQTASYLQKLIESGYEIIVSEPSVLALFRLDYKNLIENDELFEKIKVHSYDPFEYIIKIFEENKLNLEDFFDITKSFSKHLFYHGHCQQKTISAFKATVSLFEKVGFNIVTSSVECCGMAGSFGYKKDYYELSKKVGEDLIKQIEHADKESGQRILLASGTSCREQIQSFLNREILHPIEFLEKLIK